MPDLRTAHGIVSVANWGYQLQGPGGADLDAGFYASSPHDLVVIDQSRNGLDAGRFSVEEIAAIKSKPGGAVAVSYISIGEASDFRDDWNPAWTTTGLATGALTAAAPAWLGPLNPDWPESRKVRYWEEGWQSLIFNDAGTGALDKIVARGFDAAYLDIVDAYYFWAVEAAAAARKPGDPAQGDERDAAARMIDFIVAMTTHARAANPDFFVILQNGGFIIDALADLDPVRKAALLDAIGGIAVEDCYLRAGAADENNGLLPDTDLIAVLKRDFLDNDKAVFAVDYANDPVKIGQFVEKALADGFIPTVAPSRDLDRTFPALQSSASVTEDADLVAGSAAADTLHGLGGNDWLYGFGGHDRLHGDAGADLLAGGSGNDALYGGADRDRLIGGAGRDALFGGGDRDIFVFNSTSELKAGSKVDYIGDFQRRVDDISLSAIDASSRASGNQAFRWIGSNDFNGRAGELRFHDTGRHGYVEGDINGDGRADFKLLVLNVSGLERGDFVL